MTRARVDAVVDLDSRLHAHLVDHGLVAAGGALAGITLLLLGVAPVVVVTGAAVTGLAGLVVLGALLGATGRTPGGARARTRVRGRDGGPLGVGRGVVRTLLLALVGWGSVGVGWLLLALSLLRDPDGRSWVDRVVGSARVPADIPGSVPAAAVEVPRPRRPEPRELPQQWWLDLDDGEAVEVVDRLTLGHVEFARMPDGALAVRDLGSPGATILVRRGAARTLPVRRPATVLPGDRLRVDDRWLRVREPRPVAAPR